jgi:hypothetical protein
MATSDPMTVLSTYGVRAADTVIILNFAFLRCAWRTVLRAGNGPITGAGYGRTGARACRGSCGRSARMLRIPGSTCCDTPAWSGAFSLRFDRVPVALRLRAMLVTRPHPYQFGRSVKRSSHRGAWHAVWRHTRLSARVPLRCHQPRPTPELGDHLCRHLMYRGLLARWPLQADDGSFRNSHRPSSEGTFRIDTPRRIPITRWIEAKTSYPLVLTRIEKPANTSPRRGRECVNHARICVRTGR